MKRTFLLAIKANSYRGIVEGNFLFDLVGALNYASLKEAKILYCRAALKKGFKCRPEDCTIYAVIPLEA